MALVTYSVPEYRCSGCQWLIERKVKYWNHSTKFICLELVCHNENCPNKNETFIRHIPFTEEER